jgi:hypothetical protein
MRILDYVVDQLWSNKPVPKYAIAGAVAMEIYDLMLGPKETDELVETFGVSSWPDQYDEADRIITRYDLPISADDALAALGGIIAMEVRTRGIIRNPSKRHLRRRR